MENNPLIECKNVARRLANVLIFAMSLLLPAPNFISGMDDNEFIIWLVRLIWVIGLPVIFCSLILIIALLTKIVVRDKS